MTTTAAPTRPLPAARPASGAVVARPPARPAPQPPPHRSPSPASSEPNGNTTQLVLASFAFLACFAVFGCVAALMPTIAERLKLSESQVGVAIAVPIFLGGALRVPVGILTDRWGGRAVLLGILSFAVLPAVAMGLVRSYAELLVVGFFLGVPLSVFPVGVSLVSGWYPPGRQGTALGLLGLGNFGHSLALVGAPLIARQFGYAWGFWAYGLLVAACALVIALFCRNAPGATRVAAPQHLADYLRPLASPTSWALGLFYFLTFGGFLALTGYLPKILTLSFGLTKPEAGVRAAVFVLLCTAMRPVGGWLADRAGGRRVLLAAFPATALAALLMAWPHPAAFTVGTLGVAVALGLGNGAVFKLVPQSFPTSVGAVTGLVGAAGALGGFFPPVLMGVVRDATGSFALGFVALALFAVVCTVLCVRSRP